MHPSNRPSWRHCGPALALLLLTLAAHAAEFVSGTNIETPGGTIALARHWEPLLQEGFEGDLRAWHTENFESNLTLGPSAEQPHTGGKCFLLSYRQGVDTAWELRSPQVEIKPGQPVWLRLWARGNRSLTNVQGHSNLYWQRLEWLDATGAVLGTVPIVLGEANEQWHQLSFTGEAPARTAAVQVRLGCDAPSFGAGEYLALDDLQLLTHATPPDYEPAGEFVSRPLRLAAKELPKLNWAAQGQVRLQLRFAADDNGAPGPWSAFAGPQGSESWYMTPGTSLPAAARGAGWFQYRVALATTDKRQSPVLKSVFLVAGKTVARDANWAGPDVTAPAVTSYGPTRTTTANPTLGFTLTDSGAGLDPRTVVLTLDGRKLDLRRAANGRFEAALTEALTPPALLPGFRNWRTRNHGNNLQLKPLEPRVSGSANALRVTRAAGDADTAFALTSPDIPVVGGEAYTLRYWLRSDLDLTGVDRRYAEGLRWFGADGKPLGPALDLDFGAARAEWTEVAREVTAPAGAASAVLALGWDNPNISGGHYVDFADVELAGPRPAVTTGPNLHYLQVSAADFAGNRLQADWYLLVKEAPASGRVTVRPDGVTLVDGKPYFPIGIYSVSKRPANNNSFDDALAELKAAGFNLMHTYSVARNEDFRELYAAARKHGMMMFVAPESGNNNPDAASALATVVQECNEPTLLSWYLADDTAGWIGVEELRRVHQAIRDVDPYHLTVQADAARSYPDYVNSTVAFLPEIYPIRSQAGNHVADVIRDMKTVQEAWRRAGHKTPVWAIIQDFEGWGWQRFPTDEEERCMVYLALIHGAQGMTWYTYAYRDDKHGAPWDPQKWAYLKRIAGELSSLSQVFTSAETPGAVTGKVTAGPAQGDLDYPSLNLRLYTWQGQRYLLAANSAYEPITAEIKAPGLKTGAEVLFENRRVNATAGKLVDEFAPLAVHVYRW